MYWYRNYGVNCAFTDTIDPNGDLLGCFIVDSHIIEDRTPFVSASVPRNNTDHPQSSQHSSFASMNNMRRYFRDTLSLCSSLQSDAVTTIFVQLQLAIWRLVSCCTYHGQPHWFLSSSAFFIIIICEPIDQRTPQNLK